MVIWLLGLSQEKVLTSRSKILAAELRVEEESATEPPLTQTDHVRRGVAALYTENASISNNTADHGWQFARFPRLFVIGFGKAGTKALYETIKLHPQYAGPQKEVRFFSRHYSKGLGWYLDALPHPPSSHMQVVEKSPDYVTTKEAANRIKKAALSLGVSPSSLKFIIIVRNPVTRSVSEYLEWNEYRLSKRMDSLKPFFKLVLTETGELATSIAFINSSLYAYHIQAGKWFSEFSRSQFCFVNGDRFRKDPCSEAQKLEKCLKIQPFFSEYNFVYDDRTKKYCLRDRYGVTRCFGVSKGRPHPDVQQDVIDKLKAHFNQWNKQLYHISLENYEWEDSSDA